MTTILLLAGAGLALLLAEVFLPGGILGIVGGLLLLSAVALGYVNFGFVTGTIFFVGVLAVAGLGFAGWMAWFPRLPVGRQFILSKAIAGERPSPSLLAREGVALTMLRPAGTAKIDGRRVDVVSESDFIEEGSAILVVAVEGNRVVVRKKA